MSHDEMFILGVIVFFAVSVAGIFALAFRQSRRDRDETSKSSDEEWVESGFQDLPRASFVLSRIVPTDSWTKAEYVFQDEQRNEFGRYLSNGRFSADITYGGHTAKLYIKGGPFVGSAFAGKVGGQRKRSIVIRDDLRVIAEAERLTALPPIRYCMTWEGRVLQIRVAGWLARQGTIEQDGRTIGAFHPSVGISRKTLVALERTLPDELRVCMCSLAILC